MTQTSIRVSPDNRDKLAGIARDELGGASLDEALRKVLFEHQTRAAIARLEADPEALQDYRYEAQQLAENDTDVVEW